MLSVCSWTRKTSLAAICATAALLALPAAGQAALVSSGECTVPSASQQFAGDPHSYYDTGGLSVSPGSPQQVQACVNVAHPTVRVTVAGADPGATLYVHAGFDTGSATVAIRVGRVSGTGLSQVMTINVVNAASVSDGGTVPVTLTFGARGGGVQVSNTWIDPWGG